MGDGRYSQRFDTSIDTTNFSHNCWKAVHNQCKGKQILKRTGKLCNCDCHKVCSEI